MNAGSHGEQSRDSDFQSRERRRPEHRLFVTNPLGFRTRSARQRRGRPALQIDDPVFRHADVPVIGAFGFVVAFLLPGGRDFQPAAMMLIAWGWLVGLFIAQARPSAAGLPVFLAVAGFALRAAGYRRAAIAIVASELAAVGAMRLRQTRHAAASLAALAGFGLLVAGGAISWHKPRLLKRWEATEAAAPGSPASE